MTRKKSSHFFNFLFSLKILIDNVKNEDPNFKEPSFLSECYD